jgi:hypothetical protein
MKYKCIAIASALMLSLSAHADTILTYTFDPGSIFDLGGGNTYAATGSFGYDVTTGQVVSVAYQAVQTGTGPTGPFIFTTATTVSPTDVIFSGDCCGDDNEYFFSQSLALGGTSVITGGAYPGIDTVASGSVTAAAGVVPEPASWAFMLAGLGLVGRSLRRRTGADAR